MIENKQKAIKCLILLLIFLTAAAYILSLLVALFIPEFQGMKITESFQATVSDSAVIVFIILLTQTISFFCINRICLYMEQNPERENNETIMKAKKTSGIGFIFGILIVATFFLFIQTRFDIIANQYIYSADSARQSYQEIFNLGEDKAKVLLDTHLIYAAVWVILFGTFFMLGMVFTNFYMGRLLSHYGSYKENKESGSRPVILKTFGIAWSLQFLISYFAPLLIGLLIHGILTIFYCYALLQIYSEKVFEIPFKSNYADLRKEERANKRKQKYFQRIIQISILFSLLFFGVLWFGSTFNYGVGNPWYDWGFYFLLGILVLIFPIFALLNAKKPIWQWILKKCFLIISLISFFYFTLAIFSYTDLLNNYMFSIFFTGKVHYLTIAPGFLFKPGQYLVLFLLFFTSMTSLIGLKKNLLPVSTNSKKSLKEYFNIFHFSLSSKIFIGILAVSIVFSFIAYNGFGGSITLENNKDFSPQISFWEWDQGWDDHDNATLDKLEEYDMNIYGGYAPSNNTTRMEWYYERGIKVRPTGDNYGWIQWIEDQKVNESWNKCPVDGFIEDIEDGGSLYEFNRTKNVQKRTEYEELIDYVHQHNFSQHFTAMHTTINDQRDGDMDMSIFHQIHSFPPHDWDSWNWMIYRTESATSYEEESPYFTYVWVTELQETVSEIYHGKYDDKLSVSIGVTSSDRGLYANEKDGLDQLIWDLRICDALGISEVIIFKLDAMLELYEEQYDGVEVLDIIAEKINDWDKLNLKYSRSATFMGNIKYLENPMGSVFGNFWLDLFLNNGMLLFAITWIVFQSLTYAKFIMENLPSNLKNSKEREKKLQG
ncbi:MAG: hypothetical protein R6U96_01385 [Promethearchaeia archaeon]